MTVVNFAVMLCKFITSSISISFEDIPCENRTANCSYCTIGMKVIKHGRTKPFVWCMNTLRCYDPDDQKRCGEWDAITAVPACSHDHREPFDMSRAKKALRFAKAAYTGGWYNLRMCIAKIEKVRN